MNAFARAARAARALEIQPVVAPFAMLRVTVLPYRELVELAPPQVGRCIDRIVAARAEMDRVREVLAAALHAAVPLADDRSLRAAVIELKRDVHNARPRCLDPVLRARIATLLTGDAADSIATWTEAAAALVVATTELERVFATEVNAHTRARLRALGARPEIARPLVLSSRDLYRRLLAERTRLPSSAESSKTERSLLGYITRAAAKTSPFSTFMHVAAVRFDDGDALALDPERRTARVRASRGVVNLLFRHGVAPARARAGASLALDPTLRSLGDGRLELIASEYVAMNRRPWRDDVPVRLRFHARIADVIADLPSELTWDVLCARLVAAGLAPDSADAFAARLLARGVIRVAAASDVFDEDPAAELVALAAATPGVAEPVRRAVVGLAEACAELPGLDDLGRLATLDRVDAAVGAGLASCGISELGYRNTIFEDGTFAEPCGRLPAASASLVADVAHAIRPLVRLSGAYAVIRDHFVEKFGRGGCTTAVAEFLASAHARVLATSSARLAVHLPRPDGVRAGVTAFCQIALPARGDRSLASAPVVVNRAYAGIGWLSARRALGRTPGNAALATWIADWIRGVGDGAEPIDLVLCGECNDLQAHPRMTRRVLAWPTEPFRSTRQDVLRIDQIALRHDVATGLVRFEIAGDPIAPISLGNAMPMPGWGAKFALVQLTQPFELERPRIAPPDDPGVEVERRPAKVDGRVALGRTTWWMTASRMRERWFAHGGARRLVEVAVDCARHGIPTRFFVNPFVPPSAERRSIPEDALKPLWVDVKNPFCLDLLERITTYSSWMTIKEVFPDEPDMWARVGGEAHASELAFEMLV